LLLDRGLRLLDCRRVSMGGVHGTVADPKIIFRKAIEAGASCIVVAHNHPSGQLGPAKRTSGSPENCWKAAASWTFWCRTT
jgi:DNA repair protein RadC